MKNLIKRDCFAYVNEKRCVILSAMMCKSKNCSFYKTREQFRADLQKYPNVNYEKMYNENHKKGSEVL